MVGCRSVSTLMDPKWDLFQHWWISNEKLSCYDTSLKISTRTYRLFGVADLLPCGYMFHRHSWVLFPPHIVSRIDRMPIRFLIMRLVIWSMASSMVRGSASSMVRGSVFLDGLVAWWSATGCLLAWLSSCLAVFLLGLGAMSWNSKNHPTVVLSSIAAEYGVTCYGTCEAIWLRRLLVELGFVQSSCTLLRCDN